MNSLDKKSIFDANSQLLAGVTPSDIRPIYDRVVIRALADDKEGAIWLPHESKDKARIRRGEVVAVGDGDTFIQRGKPDNQGRTKVRAVKCDYCGGFKCWTGNDAITRVCKKCDGTGLGTLPMSVKVGDIVLFDRRREAEFNIRGEMYCLVNESQSILAVLE